MMTSDELSRFERSLRNRHVLTAYLDLQGLKAAGDEAQRRREIARQVALVHESLREAPHAELAAFHQCVARLEGALDAAFAAGGMRGWAGFFPVDGEAWLEPLPVQMPLLVAWEAGPRIAPYVRALKQHVPAIVAILGADGAATYRYSRGAVERVDTQTFPGGAAPEASLRGDDITRALVARLDGIAGPDAWIFIGGEHAAATRTIGALPDATRKRAHWLRGVDAFASDAQVRAAAEHMATAASRVRDLELVLDVFDRVATRGAGVAGLAATREALSEGVVDMIFFTGGLVRDCAAEAEELVRLALDHGAGVEYVSAAAAERLDEGGGVGALLRQVPAPTPAARSRRHAITPGPR